MARKRRSINEKLQEIQQDEFVGREFPLQSFRENLSRDPADRQFKNIINIYGQGGVGKTTLCRQFEKITSEEKAVSAYTDEGIETVPAFMEAVATQLESKGYSFSKFLKLYRTYRQKKRELEADPEAPQGFAGLLGRTMARGGLTLVRQVPGAKAVLDVVDTKAVVEQAGEWATFVAKRLSNKDDVQLVLEPEKVLTPIWLEDLDEVSDEKKVCLFIDTYEAVSSFMDGWIRWILEDPNLGLAESIVLIIAGRKPLNQNHWSRFNSLILNYPLEPFTIGEAKSFLDSKGIKEERLQETIMNLSGCLPVLLATLAETSPKMTEDLADVSTTAVERFLIWVKDPLKREVALHAAVPRKLNLDTLSCIAPNEKVNELFQWLQSMPFVKKRAQEWTYHPVVRAQMLRHLRQISLRNWTQLHQKLANFFEEEERNLQLPEKDRLQNEQWQLFAIQRLYHRYSEASTTYQKKALNEFLEALREKKSIAGVWADTIKVAEEDMEIEAWGNKLVSALRDYDKEEYDALQKILTQLVDSDQLEEKFKVIAIAWQGELSRLQGAFPEAISYFDRALELDPEYDWVLSSRGEVHRNMEQYEEALQDFDIAIELNPRNNWAKIRRGSVFIELEKYQEALDNFQKALEVDLENKRFISFRGLTYQLMEQYDKALKDFDRAIELDPEYDWAYANRGETYRLMEQYEEALQDFNKAIELDPEYDWAIASRGQVYQFLKRYEKALQDFDKSIDLNPEGDWKYANRGEIYRLMGNYEKALQDFDKAIELDPEYDWAYACRGQIFLSLKKYENAWQDFDRAIELNPEYAWAYSSRGKTYHYMERYEEALQDYNKAIELNPDGDWIFGNRGRTYRFMERYEEALQDFNKAIELNPEYDWVIGQRGEIYRLMNNYEEALQDFSKAIEIDKKNDWAIASRAQVHSSLENFENALQDINIAIVIDPEIDWYFETRGGIYLQLDQYEEALKDLDRAIELDPENKVSRFFQSLIYLKKGKNGHALNLLNELIEMEKKALAKGTAKLEGHLELAVYYLVKKEIPIAKEHIDKVLGSGVEMTKYPFIWFIDDLIFLKKVFPERKDIEEMLLWAQENLKIMGY